jgi:RNA polymerase-interacting CarD/CdnL/TRCF family regulator
MFFFKKVEIIEEEEEEKVISINDLYEELEEEINVSSIFTITKLSVLRNLFKKDTKDLTL